MALISFKFHRKTLLFLFGLAVLNGFQEYIYSNIIPKDDKPAENFKEKYNPLLLMVIIYFGDICCGIFIGVGIILLSFFAILNGIYNIKLYDIFSMKNYIQAALIIVHFPLSRNRYHFEFSDFLNL